MLLKRVCLGREFIFCESSAFLQENSLCMLDFRFVLTDCITLIFLLKIQHIALYENAFEVSLNAFTLRKLSFSVNFENNYTLE